MTAAIQQFFTRPRWLAWQQRHTSDALILIAIGLVTYAAAHFYELPPHLLQFGLDHADWEADDLIFVVFILSAALIIYGFRRYRDLAREIKARIEAEEEARNLARHDPLTGLPNRRFFEAKLDECLDAVGAGEQLAVLMLDLDGFKAVNDVHGHGAGDQALSEFARRVSVMLRPDAFLARIGGDEFSIIMPAIGSIDEATNLARRIATTVAEPFDIEQAIVRFGVGVGIAVAPGDGTQADELVRRADRARALPRQGGRTLVRPVLRARNGRNHRTPCPHGTRTEGRDRI